MWKSPTWENDQPGWRGERVDRQAEPASRARLALQSKDPAAAELAQGSGGGAGVDGQSVGHLAGRGGCEKSAVTSGFGAERDLLQDDPRGGDRTRRKGRASASTTILPDPMIASASSR